jgi:hypothetical protein
MVSLKDEINDKILSDGYDEHCRVSVKDVIAATSRLKLGKHDAHSGLTTDHVKHACDEWYVHLSMLLSALVVHGSITDDLSVTTILPIPKGKNLNYSSSANYRGIALSSIIGKIFDAYILDRYYRLLVSTEVQFGFKAAHSTAMCSMILKETIEHYRCNNSSVFCVMLDATKAFDRVGYCKLMRLLIGRKLPAVIIRMLLNMYLLHVTSADWNGSHSLSFRVWNGVRQGAIISPILFCVYFDVLLCQLCSQDIGCHIGSLFVGTLAYADDLVLIAPSAHAMRLMLKVCDDYATQYSVIFNASKSKCLHCLPPGTSERSPLPQPFYIESRAIEFVDKWPHLGHTLTNKNDDAEDILSRRLSFIEQVNKVIFNFRKVDCMTKTKLVNAYCTSFYGAEIWDLSHRDIESLCTSWRKGLRRIWHIPHNTHSVLLPRLSNTLPLMDVFYKRMVSFVQRCLSSESLLVRSFITQAILYGQADSFSGRNVRNCCLRYHVALDDIVTFAFGSDDIDERVVLSSDDKAKADWLIELLQCRDNLLQLSNSDFNAHDINSMITLLCHESQNDKNRNRVSPQFVPRLR